MDIIHGNHPLHRANHKIAGCVCVCLSNIFITALENNVSGCDVSYDLGILLLKT
jgi:hypothetical protein